LALHYSGLLLLCCTFLPRPCATQASFQVSRQLDSNWRKSFFSRQPSMQNNIVGLLLGSFRLPLTALESQPEPLESLLCPACTCSCTHQVVSIRMLCHFIFNGIKEEVSYNCERMCCPTRRCMHTMPFFVHSRIYSSFCM